MVMLTSSETAIMMDMLRWKRDGCSYALLKHNVERVFLKEYSDLQDFDTAYMWLFMRGYIHGNNVMSNIYADYVDNYYACSITLHGLWVLFLVEKNIFTF
jgi:hypothetical protein